MAGVVDVPADLKGSSRVEVSFAAHAAVALHACGVLTATPTVATVSASLNAGKAADLCDMRFGDGAAEPDLLADYDHCRTHREDKVESDVAKTRTLLRHYPHALVVRVRVKTVELPLEETDRLLLVHVKSETVWKQAEVFVRALAKRLCAYAALATYASTPKHRRLADEIVHAILKRTCVAYATAVRDLLPLMNNDDANVRTLLLGTDGLTQRYDVLVKVSRRLVDDYGVTNLCKFFSDSMAAKLDDTQRLFAFLDALRDPSLGIVDLQTFLCGGIAARMDDLDAILAFARKIKTEYGVKDVQPFMCNGIAAHMETPADLDAFVATLKTEYGIKEEKLQTFMNNGVGARVADPTNLLVVLDFLKSNGVTQFQTFVTDGMAAQCDDPDAVIAALNALHDGRHAIAWGTMPTFFNHNSVAAMLATPDVLYGVLDTLRDTFGVTVTMHTMVTKVASLLKTPEALFAHLRTLQQPPFSVTDLTSFMNRGLTSKLRDDPERCVATLTTVYTQFNDDVLATSIVKSNDKFFSRLYTKGFLDAVFCVLAHARGLGMTTDQVRTTMRIVCNPANTALMDAIEPFAAKFGTFTDATSARAYVARFKYSKGGKGRTAYHAALKELVPPQGSKRQKVA
jgi:hypothetical protein